MLTRLESFWSQVGALKWARLIVSPYSPSPFYPSTPPPSLAAGRVRSKKKKEKITTTRNPAAPKTHHETHSSPATATNSRWRAMKHVPRVSPCSPAALDPGFVEIGFVQLSQSVITTNDSHTHRQTNQIMAPCTQPGTIREVNEARCPHTCSRPCAYEEKKNKKKKTKKKNEEKKNEKKTRIISRRTQNTPRNPQQPGDRDHLETVCDETRPTR